MANIAFIPKETTPGEARVAASPDTVKRLVKLGFRVVVETGAGEGSSFTDDEFLSSGAEIGNASRDATVILKVRRPSNDEIAAYNPCAFVLAMMDPYGRNTEVQQFAARGLTTFAMEFMPRITRAQSMDVLSSQANLAGYQAVVEAAALFNRAMPMMMTAAGTVPAAKVFVMGAGVAGLQAIATARRLGAAVSATDVRPAAKEQVSSLGAKFIAVEDDEFKAAETSGGYAKEMSSEYQKKQADLVAEHISKQDIVITTALIPGRKAPLLVSMEMLRSMRRGAIAVDLAAERGGNIEGVVPGEIATVEGVTVVGFTDMPGRVAASASSLYAKNLLTFLESMLDKDQKHIALNMEDELIRKTMLTHAGKVVHPALCENLMAVSV